MLAPRSLPIIVNQALYYRRMFWEPMKHLTIYFHAERVFVVTRDIPVTVYVISYAFFLQHMDNAGYSILENEERGYSEVESETKQPQVDISMY